MTVTELAEALCGLLIERPEKEPIPVPLTGVSVNVRIIDLVAEVNIEQRYVNREQQPIEAVYKFPFDEGAAVCKFTAEVDGRVIEGVVKEKEEAVADYDKAIESGQSAFLLEETLPDVFKAKVGNLAAGSGAKIRLTYVTELKVEEGEIRFYLPTTIAPRYIPANDTSSVATDLASIKYTTESHYSVEFTATVQTASTIKAIRSPTHKITVTHDPLDPLKGALRLEEHVACMDRDLVLYIEIAEAHQPRLIHEKSSSGSGAVMLSLVPSFKLEEQKTELIFLVDRSGSMEGPGITQARQALKLFLHSLPLDCYVNIAGFGCTYEELFPSSRKYDESVLLAAKSHTETLEANLGGTEIYNPLEQIFKKPIIDGYLRQVFVLTDGEVSNVDKVISLVRRESGRTRVFALGLGSSASHYLVEGIARAGNGTALFASLEERLEKKVMQQLQDALQPALTNIKIKWEGYDDTIKDAEVPVQTEKSLIGYGKPLPESKPEAAANPPVKKLRQAPCDKMVPAVFNGKNLVIYALLVESAHLPEWAEVTASSPVGTLCLRVELNEKKSVEGQLVQCLAAKKLIQALQEREGEEESERKYDDDGESEGSKKMTEIKKEIIQLGCQYGLASRYTSYVAVDPKEQKELKESWMTMISRDIPVELAHGWGGGFGGGVRGFRSMPMMLGGAMPRMFRDAMPMALACPMPAMALGCPMPSYLMDTKSMTKRSLNVQCDPVDDVMVEPESFEFDSVEENQEMSHPLDSSAPYMMQTEDETEPKSIKTPTNDDKLMTLVSTQNFDGSFKLEPELAKLLDTTLQDIQQAGQLGSYSELVWATALALAYMTLALVNLKSSWMLVAKKAENWLQSQLLADKPTCMEAATDFVKTKLKL